MKKILCALLALCMLAAMLLVGCTPEEEKKTTAGGSGLPTESKEDPNSIYDAEVKKLNRKFTFIARSSTSSHLDTHEIFAEALNGEKINDAVFSRNSILAEKYGAEVEVVDSDANPGTKYRDSLVSGEYVADFIFDDIDGMRKLAAANLLVDFNTLDTLNLNKIWWNKNMSDALAISGKAFYVTGDAATLDDRAAWVMTFNKDIVANAGLPSPYELVKAGTWTVEEMYKYVSQCADDVNDDGVFTYKTDIVGYAGEPFNNWVHVAAGGITVSNISADGVISIPDQPKQEILDALSKLRPLLTVNSRWLNSSTATFCTGLIVFQGTNAGAMAKFGEQEVNFGIIPFPKITADQKDYYTTVSHAQFGVYSIPQSVSNNVNSKFAENGFRSVAEENAYFMEAFGYYSMNTLTPAYYDQILMKQTVQDLESREYLALTLDKDHIVFDPVVLFRFGACYSAFTGLVPDTGKMSNELTYDTFVSAYAAKVDAARTALEDYITITSLS